MKKFAHAIGAILICCLVTSAQAAPRPQQAGHHQGKPKEDKEQQNMAGVMVANISQIIMNIIAMITNSHNPQSLVAGSCGIVNGISNIVQEAVKMVREEQIPEAEVAQFIHRRFMELGFQSLVEQDIVRCIGIQQASIDQVAA